MPKNLKISDENFIRKSFKPKLEENKQNRLKREKDKDLKCKCPKNKQEKESKDKNKKK